MKAPARILVVDDEACSCKSLVSFLKKDGHDVGYALDAEAALDLLDRESFDLVFLELMLPGVDGHELLRTLRSRWPGTWIIVMSCYGSIQSAVEVMRSGAFEFLAKPLSPSEVASATSRALARKSPSSQERNDHDQT